MTVKHPSRGGATEQLDHRITEKIIRPEDETSNPKDFVLVVNKFNSMMSTTTTNNNNTASPGEIIPRIKNSNFR